VDATQLLANDHNAVRQLFREYGAAKNPQARGRICEQVCQELKTHTQIEEQFFYPAVRSRCGDQGQDLVRESLQEHHEVDKIIAQLERLEPDNPEYDSRFRDLMKDVEHHAGEEEQDLFPLARQCLSGVLDRLGTEMERRKHELLAEAR